ncbi:hypothetical protein STENM327S_00247 [Streptomyces tendae]
MRFAAYEHRDRHRVAVVEEDGTLLPLPGVTSLTALIEETDGLPGLLAAGAAALDVPRARTSPRSACCLRCGPPRCGTS